MVEGSEIVKKTKIIEFDAEEFGNLSYEEQLKCTLPDGYSLDDYWTLSCGYAYVDQVSPALAAIIHPDVMYTLDKVKIDDLKPFAKAHGLKVGGRAAELKQRIADNVDHAEIMATFRNVGVFDQELVDRACNFEKMTEQYEYYGNFVILERSIPSFLSMAPVFIVKRPKDDPKKVVKLFLNNELRKMVGSDFNTDYWRNEYRETLRKLDQLE